MTFKKTVNFPGMMSPSEVHKVNPGGEAWSEVGVMEDERVQLVAGKTGREGRVDSDNFSVQV